MTEPAVRAVQSPKSQLLSEAASSKHPRTGRGLLFLPLIFSLPTFSLRSKRYVAASRKPLIPGTDYPGRVYNFLPPPPCIIIIIIFLSNETRKQTLCHLNRAGGGKEGIFNEGLQGKFKKPVPEAILMASGKVTLS